MGRVTFTIKFDQPTAIVGYSKSRIEFQASENNDADNFVGLKKLDDDGEEVIFTYFTVYDHSPIAEGRLHASYRAANPSRPKPFQPRRNYDKEEPLNPNKFIK